MAATCSKKAVGPTLKKSAFPIVAIGASAGGLEACQKLLDVIPVKSGMAFLFVQHLDPKHESALVDLLSSHTEMTVVQAEDATRIAPDHLYVIPPGQQLSVSSGILRVEPFKTQARPRLPFDHLLTSMAKDLGKRAIAIVLSGTGSDGSQGIRDVREKGGVVLAQDPTEAAYDGMPRSAIGSGQVTHVAKLEGIADHLMHLGDPTFMHVRELPGTINGPKFDEIIDILLSLTAYDFRQYKSGTLSRRIKRRLTACAEARGDIDKYIKCIQSDPAA